MCCSRRLWPAVLVAALVVVVSLPLAGLSAAPDAKDFDFQSPYYAVGLAPTGPQVVRFSVDSLGKGATSLNTVLPEAAVRQAHLRVMDQRKAAYELPDADGHLQPTWEFSFEDRVMTIRSRYVAGANVPALPLLFNPRKNHATLLGVSAPGELKTILPAVLHLPDMGTLRITCNVPVQKLDYDARRWHVKSRFVRIGFPAATEKQPLVEYRCEVTTIHPPIPSVEGDSRFDGFRRNFLNLLQMNPRVAMLANNTASDPVGFCAFQFAELARRAPPLAEGLTVYDLVRQTIDRQLDGARTYGTVGYHSTPESPDCAPWECDYNALDLYPSLLLAAAYYVEDTNDTEWANGHWSGLRVWMEKMLAQDTNGNGLIEYPISGDSGSYRKLDRKASRPANWWDTVGFGHEDAYSNAIAYRACSQLAKVAEKLGKKDDAALLAERAKLIRANYYPTFFNEKSGVIAGWKSKDGKLHDYYFPYIQGMAVCYDLVDAQQGNAIMDRLLEKTHAVGFDRFEYGLPCNLVPVRREDYIAIDKRWGGPQLEDGSDAFPGYANGAATPIHAYWTVRALYKLGRTQDARRIFYPMLKSFTDGEFQGFGPQEKAKERSRDGALEAFGSDEKSKDWRDWEGNCLGYEGYLTDAYLAILATLDDVAAGK